MSTNNNDHEDVHSVSTINSNGLENVPTDLALGNLNDDRSTLSMGERSHGDHSQAGRTIRSVDPPGSRTSRTQNRGGTNLTRGTILDGLTPRLNGSTNSSHPFMVTPMNLTNPSSEETIHFDFESSEDPDLPDLGVSDNDPPLIDSIHGPNYLGRGRSARHARRRARNRAARLANHQGPNIPPLFYNGTEINDFRDGFVRGLPPIRWAMFVGIAVRYALPTHRLERSFVVGAMENLLRLLAIPILTSSSAFSEAFCDRTLPPSEDHLYALRDTSLRLANIDLPIRETQLLWILTALHDFLTINVTAALRSAPSIDRSVSSLSRTFLTSLHAGSWRHYVRNRIQLTEYNLTAWTDDPEEAGTLLMIDGHQFTGSFPELYCPPRDTPPAPATDARSTISTPTRPPSLPAGPPSVVSTPPAPAPTPALRSGRPPRSAPPGHHYINHSGPYETPLTHRAPPSARTAVSADPSHFHNQLDQLNTLFHSMGPDGNQRLAYQSIIDTVVAREHALRTSSDVSRSQALRDAQAGLQDTPAAAWLPTTNAPGQQTPESILRDEMDSLRRSFLEFKQDRSGRDDHSVATASLTSESPSRGGSDLSVTGSASTDGPTFRDDPTIKVLARSLKSSSVSWDGRPQDFAAFRISLEAHCSTGGIAYLLHKSFLQHYYRWKTTPFGPAKQDRERHLRAFDSLQQHLTNQSITASQFMKDRSALYGLILGVIAKYKAARSIVLARCSEDTDGILAWYLLLRQYHNPGDRATLKDRLIGKTFLRMQDITPAVDLLDYLADLEETYTSLRELGGSLPSSRRKFERLAKALIAPDPSPFNPTYIQMLRSRVRDSKDPYARALSLLRRDYHTLDELHGTDADSLRHARGNLTHTTDPRGRDLDAHANAARRDNKNLLIHPDLWRQLQPSTRHSVVNDRNAYLERGGNNDGRNNDGTPPPPTGSSPPPSGTDTRSGANDQPTTTTPQHTADRRDGNPDTNGSRRSGMPSQYGGSVNHTRTTDDTIDDDDEDTPDAELLQQLLRTT